MNNSNTRVVEAMNGILDEGFVQGLQRAARFVAEFAAQPLPGFDQATCARLREALQSLVQSEADRRAVEVSR